MFTVRPVWMLAAPYLRRIALAETALQAFVPA
jgi:hypothetical protein